MVGLETQIGDIASGNIRLLKKLEIVKNTASWPKERAHQTSTNQTQAGEIKTAPISQVDTFPQVQAPNPVPATQLPGVGLTATAGTPMLIPPAFEVVVAFSQARTYNINL